MTPPLDPKQVDALLLDLGNVIVRIDFGRVTSHWARAAGLDPAHVAARFSHDDPYQRHERAEIDIKSYFAALRSTLGMTLDDDALLEGWNAVFVEEITGVVSLLPRLAERIPLYVFSNTNHAHHEFFTQRYASALAPFRRVFVSHEVGARKPDPVAFHRVAQAIDLPPERIAFFDDLPANVEGARNIGMAGVLVSSASDFMDAVQPWLA